MMRTPDPLDSAQSDDDLAFLRAALKPFDPADQRRPDLRPPTVGSQAATSIRRSRPRTGLLVAAAAVAVAVAVTPALSFYRDSGPALQPANAARALADCNERMSWAGYHDPPHETGPIEGRTDEVPPSWFTEARAAQLTQAVQSGLPAGTCVFRGSGTGDLRFDVGDPDGYFTTGDSPTMNPEAEGRIVTPNGDGTLMVGVYPAPAGPDSCVVGEVDQQVTTSDGTIVNQTNGASWDATTRFIVLVAQAFRPDGSCVWLRVSDEVLRQDTVPGQEGMTASGAVPLTMDELTALAAAPGLTAAG